MQTFEYTAVALDGEVTTGRQRANDELELDRALETHGLTLTRVHVLSNTRSGSYGRLSRRELVTFTRQLATVISAGVPIVEGLRELSKRIRTRAGRLAVEELVRDLEAGLPLSEAMERQPGSFPDVYRASVSAGELSGDLPSVLRRLARYLEWSRAIRATTLQAMIYPCILGLAIIGLVTVLITWVLPRITGLFPGGREQLPRETRTLLAISDFMIANWLLLLLGVVLTVGGWLVALRHHQARLLLSRLALAIPRYGTVARMLATSKFASTAATLQLAGCEVYQVLSVAGRSCGNALMAHRLEAATDRVQRGQTITESLEREPIIDPLLVQMTSVGEQSGDLGDAFEKLSDYYDEEVPRMVKWFLSFLEPALLLIGGVIVAFVLIASLMPVFSLYENLG